LSENSSNCSIACCPTTILPRPSTAALAAIKTMFRHW
jgi:hypothetical protein